MESSEKGAAARAAGQQAAVCVTSSLVKYASGTSIQGKPMMCIYARRASAAVTTGRRRSPCSATATRTRSRSTTSSRSASIPPLPLAPVCLVLEGPILLTAPHGKEVWREGTWAWVRGITGRRLHRRELFTTELILRMFDSTALRGQASLVVWNARSLKDAREGLDPNYLHSAEMRTSEWHHSLHMFAKKFQGDTTGCVHFDIHGKKDRSGPSVDIGLEALRHHSPMLYDKVRSAVETRLGGMLQSVTPGKGGKRFGVSFPAPGERDNGFWQKTEDGELQRPPQAPATLVAQSAAIGVLGVQIEIPKSLRSILAASPRLISELALALNRVRTDVCNASLTQALQPACCKERAGSASASASASSNGPSDASDTSNPTPPAALVTPIPPDAVSQSIAQLLRDSTLLHLLDTERPI